MPTCSDMQEVSPTNGVGPTEECSRSMEGSSDAAFLKDPTDDHCQLPRDSARSSSTVDCICLSCYSLVRYFHQPTQSCCFPGCHYRNDHFSYNSRLKKYYFPVNYHEKSHYLNREGVFYFCQEENCHTLTKYWSDLKRHYTSKHCKKSKEFPCHHMGCSRGGSNGFPRKDKLKNHIDSVHKGPASGSSRGSVKQRIAPKPQGSA